MIKILFLLYLSVLLLSCTAKTKNDCSKFRKGKFISYSGFNQSTIVERSDSTQIETNETTGHTMRSNIKWISDCEYQLSNVEERNDSSERFKQIWGNNIIITKIVEVKKDYCVYESKMPGVSMRMIDTLRIIK